MWGSLACCGSSLRGPGLRQLTSLCPPWTPRPHLPALSPFGGDSSWKGSADNRVSTNATEMNRRARDTGQPRLPGHHLQWGFGAQFLTGRVWASWTLHHPGLPGILHREQLGQLEASEEGSDSLSEGCPADSRLALFCAAGSAGTRAPSEPHPRVAQHAQATGDLPHPSQEGPGPGTAPCMVTRLWRTGQQTDRRVHHRVPSPDRERSRRPPTFHVTRTRSSSSGAVGLPGPPLLVGKPSPWGGAQLQCPTSSGH